MEGINPKLFEEMGFTQGEIKVYFALLETGQSTIGPVSRKSGVTPAKVYPILDKLVRKGLAKYVIKAGEKNFETTHPDNIVKLLDAREREMEAQKRKIKEMMPLLLSRKGGESEQKAEIYQGLGGIKTFFNELLDMSKPGDVWIGFTLGDDYTNPQANRFFHAHHTERIRRDVHIKLIAPENQRRFQKPPGKRDRGHAEIKFLDRPVPTGLMIAYNKVSILLWNEEPIAFVITSERNADVFRKFFYDMWEISKR